MNANDGRVRWRRSLSPTNSVAALANGLAWIIDDKRANLVALAAADGRQVVSIRLGESFSGVSTPSPVIARETVLVPMPSGRLLAYRVPA